MWRTVSDTGILKRIMLEPDKKKTLLLARENPWMQFVTEIELSAPPDLSEIADKLTDTLAGILAGADDEGIRILQIAAQAESGKLVLVGYGQLKALASPAPSAAQKTAFVDAHGNPIFTATAGGEQE